MLVSAQGWSSVGGVAGSTGAFNNNRARSTVRVFDTSFYSCDGYGCNHTPQSFIESVPLIFSSNLPVPEAPTLPMLAAGPGCGGRGGTPPAGQALSPGAQPRPRKLPRRSVSAARAGLKAASRGALPLT